MSEHPYRPDPKVKRGESALVRAGVALLVVLGAIFDVWLAFLPGHFGLVFAPTIMMIVPLEWTKSVRLKVVASVWFPVTMIVAILYGVFWCLRALWRWVKNGTVPW